MDTLILSAAFEPLRPISWQRAMTLWVGGRVEIVEAYDDRVVRTPAEEFRIPAVVRAVRGLKRRSRTVRLTRRNVYGRDKGRCQYCGERLRLGEATLDHVLPRSRGGRSTWTNLVIACAPCNQRKANRTPEEAGMPLHERPTRPVFQPDAWGGGLRWKPDMPPHWAPYLGPA